MSNMPDDPEENHIFVCQLSCVDSMLQIADEVLSLAAEHPKQAKALAASGTVILAAALEQGVVNRLLQLAAISKNVDNVDPCETLVKDLLKPSTSLRRRIIELPRIISDGEFQLNPRSPYVETLHHLVSMRNELMHLKDEVTVLETSRGEVNVHDGKVTVDHSFRQPEFPWGNVTAEQARQLREAVGIYFEEVLNPNIPPGLTVGRILCRATGH